MTPMPTPTQPPTLPQGYRLEEIKGSQEALGAALDRIWRAGLMDNDEETSRVLHLADPERNPDRNGITHAWLVVESASGKDVAMACLSDPDADSCGRSVMNMFVSLDHRERGLGSCLALAVIQKHPAVAGFYTSNSVRLYQNLRLASAWPAPRDDQGTLLSPNMLDAHLGEDNLTQNQRCHVTLVASDRAEFDRVNARYRQRVRI